jgi:MFS family permease
VTLPRAAWRVLAAAALSAVGTGLTLPFLLVYLHSVRGLSLSLAGAVAGTVGLVSLVGNPVGGWLADRVGPRSAMLTGLPVAALGVGLWAAIRGPASAFAAAAVAGIGVSLLPPAQNALLATLVPAAQRSNVFAVGNATFNLGLGAGGLLAALVVDTTRPSTFVTLYLVDAASFALAAVIILTVQDPSRGRPGEEQPDVEGAAAGRPAAQEAAAGRPVGGYRAVLRDRVVIGVWLLTACLVTAGFGQFNSVLPVLMTGRGGLPARDIGLVFAVNTVTVVLAQLAVLRVLAGRRRTRAAAAMGPLWAACWALVLAAGWIDVPAGALAAFLAAAMIFALGETLLWPTLPAIVNDVAPPSLRGRYNGALSLALTTGFVLGPVLGGFALAHDAAVPLLVALIVACTGSAVVALALERVVPAEANLIPVPDGARRRSRSEST